MDVDGLSKRYYGLLQEKRRELMMVPPVIIVLNFNQRKK